MGLALLGLGTPAHADSRADARRHFRSGMAAVAAGRFDEGIAELKEAYTIKPHPAVLFNIGKAYQDAGRSQEAIGYYQQYLSYDPPDADDVHARISALEKVVPPPAPVVEKSSAPQPAPAKSAALDEANQKRLEDLLTRLDQAVSRAESLQVTPAAATPKGNAPGTSEPAAAPTGGEASAELEETQGEAYEEVVVTASRYAQSALQAPASTTTITSDEIALSGATSLPELLRRVPGADVMQLGVGSADVSMRGFNQRVANKLLVLVDGRSVYEDFLGLTLFDELPIQLEEIERIEIIRGPGSALYGANAFLGVVNIITKHPGTGPSAYARAGSGSGGQGLGTFIASGRSGRLSYRLSGGYLQAQKWSVDFAPDRADFVPTQDDPNLGLRSVKANGVLALKLARDVELSVAGGVNKLYTEIYPLGALRNDTLDVVHLYQQASLNAGPLQMRVFWNHLQGDAIPQYQPAGEASVATHIITNVLDADVQFDQRFQAAGEHRISVGAGYRLKAAHWDYLSVNPVEHHFSAFVQEEYRPVAALALTGSLRADRHPLLDNGQPGFAVSPKASAVYTFLESQAVHASVGTAFREPTLVESYTRLNIPAPGQPSVGVLTVGNQQLKPERLFAVEVGYRAELNAAEIDVALYRNQVRDLVVLSPLRPLPSGQNYDPVHHLFLAGTSNFYNDTPTYTALGGEIGIKASPADRLGLRGAFALEQISSDGIGEEDCAPCHEVPAAKIYGGASYRTAFKLDLNVDASYVSSTRWIEREVDPNNPGQINFASFPLSGYAVVSARLGYRFLDDHLEAAVVGTNLAAAHQEHPFGNRVDSRVLATLGGSL